MINLDDVLYPPQYVERFKDRHFGKRRAVVKDNRDPKRLGRVRVYCPSMYGNDLSPWAMPCFPGGCRSDTGHFDVPPIDSFVWIEFEEGFVENPIWTGGFYDTIEMRRRSDGTPIEESEQHQGNNNPVPMHFQGLPDGTDYDGSARVLDAAPDPDFAGVYPNVRGWQSPSGHRIELDDTPGAERVSIVHRAGTIIEIGVDGSVKILTEAQITTVAQAETTTVSGSRRETIGGDVTVRVGGDYNLEVDGAYTVTHARTLVQEVPAMELTLEGGYSLELGGLYDVLAGGPISLTTADSFGLTTAFDFSVLCGGAGLMSFGNSTALPGDLHAEAFGLQAMLGKLRANSADVTGLLRHGIESVATDRLGSPVATVGQDGPYTRIGNLTRPVTPEGAPLLQEPVPLGFQLAQYLMGLQSFLQAWLTDYITHAHPWFSPSYTSAVQSTILPAQLATLQATFLTPTGAKARPLVLSDTVYVSKD